MNFKKLSQKLSISGGELFSMQNVNTMKQWPNTASEANFKKIMRGSNAISEQ